MFKKLLTVFLLFTCISLFSADFIDKNKFWKIGICELSGNNLSYEDEFLKSKIPLMIYSSILDLKIHVTGEQEKIEMQRSFLQKKIITTRKALADLYKQKDDLEIKRADYIKNKRSIKLKIKTKKKELKKLLEIDSSSIEIIKDREILFIKNDQEEAILENPEIPLDIYSLKKDIDLLISGSIENISERFVLRISVFNKNLDKEVYNYYTVIEDKNNIRINQLVLDEIISIILGRSWSSFVISVPDPDGDIFIDGDYYGTERAEINYMNSGEHLIEIRNKGETVYTERVNLADKEKKVIEVDIIPKKKISYMLKSLPSGAPVWQGSEWVGTCPLLIEDSASRSELLVSPDDYLRRILIFPDEMASVDDHKTVELVPELFNSTDLFNEKRDDFYSSLGYFSIGLPVSVILYAYYVDMEGNKGDDVQLSHSTDIVKGVYFLSVFTTTVLFVNVLFQLIDYIKTAEY